MQKLINCFQVMTSLRKVFKTDSVVFSISWHTGAKVSVTSSQNEGNFTAIHHYPKNETTKNCRSDWYSLTWLILHSFIHWNRWNIVTKKKEQITESNPVISHRWQIRRTKWQFIGNKYAHLQDVSKSRVADRWRTYHSAVHTISLLTRTSKRRYIETAYLAELKINKVPYTLL